MFYSDLIIPRLKAEDRWGAIDILSAILIREGFGKPSYADGVKEREKSFPTALPTEPIKVSIPHADLEHCLKPGIAVGILTKSVPWIEIATEDKWLDVDIVFMLSITNPQAQVSWLKRLTDAFNVEGMLTGLQTLDDAEAIHSYLIRHLREEESLSHI